ncbi:MAG: VWA domain-containing protein [Anaerolineae bacterium]
MNFQSIIFQNPWALALVPAGWLLLVLFAWRRRFKPFAAFLLRLLIVVLVALALAQPILPGEETGPARPEEAVVLLVDQSASLGMVGQQALRGEAARLLRELPHAQTLFFAGQPLLIPDPLADPAAEDGASPLNRQATDLAGALTLAGNMLSPAGGGRVLLLSDGVPTQGDALAAASNLARRGIAVDVVTFDETAWREGQNEVRVVALDVPPALRQGETFNAGAVIHSEQPISATLRVTHNGESVAEDVVTLSAGFNRFDTSLTAGEPGPQVFNAAIAAAAGDDRQLQNNGLAATAQVYPPPGVLVAADDRVQGSRMAALLREAGFEAVITQPELIPTRISELEPFDGMVLVDVPATSLELEQMIAVQEFVRSLGRGLLVTGGRNSFGLGRYDGTPLAELLPLDLQPPPREERPPVALLLIIDHSGSMMEIRGNLPTRLTMAKEAAIRATDILGPEDLIGVLMFDNRYEWVVEFQPVSDGVALLDVQERIARIPGGGGTRILQALQIGIPALIEQETAASRHIVLLTDGKSFDGFGTIEDYNVIVDAAREANITLSSIAIGSGADQELLRYLAERGLGRYHFAETPEELPALTISESDILRSNALQEGDFAAAVFERHPIIRGFFPAGDESQQPPGLSSYLAMTPRPQAETALQVGPGDPLLSVWGYGLGRVAVWSSDLGAEWARPWREWPEASRFWGQVVGYTLPAPDLPAGMQVEAQLGPDGAATLAVDSFTGVGQPIDLARTQAALTPPGGQASDFGLGQVAPGRYEREVRLPAPGAYRLAVNQTHPDNELNRNADIGFVLPYPAEYALPPEGSGQLLLAQLAAATGGELLRPGDSPPGSIAAQTETEPPRPATELWPWLLQIALILWPVEIALRRWGRLRIQ